MHNYRHITDEYHCSVKLLILISLIAAAVLLFSGCAADDTQISQDEDTQMMQEKSEENEVAGTFDLEHGTVLVTYSHHFRSAKKWGLLAQQFQRTEYQRAIPVCPTVPLLDISLLLS